MEPTMKDYVDARIGESQARLDAKLSEIVAEIRILQGNSLTLRGSWYQTAAIILTIGALLVGILGFGGDRFDGGMNASSVVQGVRQSQAELSGRVDGLSGRMDEMDQRLGEMDQRLGRVEDQLSIIIERLPAPQQPVRGNQ